MALPDFGDEACFGGQLTHQGKQLHPVDLTVVDLQPFTIHVLGVSQMQVGCERKDRPEEATEGGIEVGAGELGVGGIQADAHAGFLAEFLDEVGVDEEVVIALPPEVPGEGGHGLGNDFHIVRGVDLPKALDQALP